MTNENIGDILARRLRSRGLDKAALAAWVCATADKVGGAPPRGLCPAGGGQREVRPEAEFEALSFKNGTLKIRVSSGARAHLIKMREKDYISKINSELKRNLVERLRFEID